MAKLSDYYSEWRLTVEYNIEQYIFIHLFSITYYSTRFLIGNQMYKVNEYTTTNSHISLMLF